MHVYMYGTHHTGAFRAEAPFAFTGTAQEAYALMDQHTVKLTEKEAQVSECQWLPSASENLSDACSQTLGHGSTHAHMLIDHKSASVASICAICRLCALSPTTRVISQTCTISASSLYARHLWPRQVKQYNELEDLFELQISKYPECHDTREELRLLRSLWDFKSNMMKTYG
jgi:hypothetical protein